MDGVMKTGPILLASLMVFILDKVHSYEIEKLKVSKHNISPNDDTELIKIKAADYEFLQLLPKSNLGIYPKGGVAVATDTRPCAHVGTYVHLHI